MSSSQNGPFLSSLTSSLLLTKPNSQTIVIQNHFRKLPNHLNALLHHLLHHASHQGRPSPPHRHRMDATRNYQLAHPRGRPLLQMAAQRHQRRPASRSGPPRGRERPTKYPGYGKSSPSARTPSSSLETTACQLESHCETQVGG